MPFRWLVALVFLLVAAGAAAQPAKAPVVVSTGADGTALWLPGETNLAGETVAAAIHRRFSACWKGLFGVSATVADPLLVPRTGDLAEGVFVAMWAEASAVLHESDRPAALSALRSMVLGDPTPLVEGLARAAGSPRLGEPMVQDALLYLFLSEAASDPSFLPEALPPGPGGARLKRALERRGTAYPAFLRRYAAWILSRAVEARLIERVPGTLPAVWALSEDLPAGGWASCSFDLPDAAAAVDLAVAGEGPDLHVLTFLTDASGRVLKSGIGALSENGSLPLAAGVTRLWVVLWNTGRRDLGAGLALTLWADHTPPFRVREGALEEGTLDLLLEERAGILDYSLFSRPLAEGTPVFLPVPAFPSRGAGVHRYRLALVPEFEGAGDLFLQCRTRSGGAYQAPLHVKVPSRP